MKVLKKGLLYYTPTEIISGVNRNEEVNQLKVNASELRVRKEANLKSEILGFAKTGDIYNDLEVIEADGYKWHRIYNNNWLAEVNIELLPKKITDYKKLYEEEKIKASKLELEVKDLKSQVEILNNKINNIKKVVNE